MRIPKVERWLRDRQIRARDEFDDFEEMARFVVKFPTDSEPGIDRRLELQNRSQNPNADEREAEPDLGVIGRRSFQRCVLGCALEKRAYGAPAISIGRRGFQPRRL